MMENRWRKRLQERLMEEEVLASEATLSYMLGVLITPFRPSLNEASD